MQPGVRGLDSSVTVTAVSNWPPKGTTAGRPAASPLRWIAVMGLGVCLVAALWVLYVMVQAVVNPESLEKGWASLIAVIVFLGGVQLVSVGMLGQYVSRIFEEGKRRPLYLVREDTKTGGA